MAAKKGARPVQDERAIVGEQLAEEYEAHPRLSASAIYKRTALVRADAEERWRAFVDDHDRDSSLVLYTMPIPERIEHFFTRAVSADQLVESLFDEDTSILLKNYVAAIRALLKAHAPLFNEDQYSMYGRAFIADLQRSQGAEDVQEVCRSFMESEGLYGFGKMIVSIANSILRSRVEIDETARQESVVLFDGARALKGKERTRALEMLFGSDVISRSILQDAFFQDERSDEALQSLKQSGAFLKLVEQVDPDFVLQYPNLFDVTAESYTRIETMHNQSLFDIAQAMNRQSGREGGLEQWRSWIDSLSDVAFDEHILTHSESLFSWMNTQHPERVFFQDAYGIIVDRVATMIERKKEQESRDDPSQQFAYFSYHWVHERFPHLSIDAFVNTLPVLIERGMFSVGTLPVNEYTQGLVTNAIKGEAAMLFFRRSFEGGAPAKDALKRILASDFNLIMGSVDGRERLEMMEQLLEPISEGESLKDITYIVLDAARAHTFEQEGGAALLERYMELFIPDHVWYFFHMDGFFALTTTEQARRIVEMKVKESPFLLAHLWEKTHWQNPEDGIAVLQSLKERGIEPFAWAGDVELFDKLLRYDWWPGPVEILRVSPGDRRPRTDDELAKEKEQDIVLLKEMEQWLADKPPVERIVVLSRRQEADMHKVVHLTDEDDKKTELYRYLQRENKSTQAIVHAVESVIGPEPNAQQEADIRALTHLLVDNVRHSLESREAVATLLTRAHFDNDESDVLPRMLRSWLTQEFGLSQETLTAWLEVGQAQEARMNFGSHIAALNEIELAIPGGAALLEKEFGIRAFGRYPIDTLIAQVNERSNTEKPYGVIVAARGDHNGALFNQNAVARFAELDHHLTRIVEVESLRDVARRFLQMERRGYPKASFILIEAHGTPDAVQFGIASRYDAQGMGEEGRQFGTRHLKGRGVIRFGERFIVSNAPVVWNSCSTGAEGGISENVSDVWDLEMIAPSAPCSIDNIELDETPQAVRVRRVSYIGVDQDDGKPPEERRFVRGRLRRA